MHHPRRPPPRRDGFPNIKASRQLHGPTGAARPPRPRPLARSRRRVRVPRRARVAGCPPPPRAPPPGGARKRSASLEPSSPISTCPRARLSSARREYAPLASREGPRSPRRADALFAPLEPQVPHQHPTSAAIGGRRCVATSADRATMTPSQPSLHRAITHAPSLPLRSPLSLAQSHTRHRRHAPSLTRAVAASRRRCIAPSLHHAIAAVIEAVGTVPTPPPRRRRRRLTQRPYRVAGPPPPCQLPLRPAPLRPRPLQPRQRQRLRRLHHPLARRHASAAAGLLAGRRDARDGR